MSNISALQQSDLNPFLFADVGTEASGMMLSVVSLFARQGNDPWREAGRLADLSKDKAADSLAHDIAEMPHGPWKLPDAAMIAARLVGLLPVRPARPIRSLPSGISNWKLSARSVIVPACLALGIAYAVSVMMSSPPAPVNGSDASSLAVPSTVQPSTPTLH
jgi:hypothetical protein